MVCGNFILPEPASYVFFYAIFNLRNLFYLISIVLYFPMCFFRAGRKNFTVFTTLDFSTAFLLPSQSIYSEIKPKCRSASLIASTFSGGQG